jgi:hypothetical protein
MGSLKDTIVELLEDEELALPDVSPASAPEVEAPEAAETADTEAPTEASMDNQELQSEVNATTEDTGSEINAAGSSASTGVSVAFEESDSDASDEEVMGLNMKQQNNTQELLNKVFWGTSLTNFSQTAF